MPEYVVLASEKRRRRDRASGPRRRPWVVRLEPIEPRRGDTRPSRTRVLLVSPLRGFRLIFRSSHGLRRGLRLFRAFGAFRIRTAPAQVLWLPLRGRVGRLPCSHQIETSSLPLAARGTGTPRCGCGRSALSLRPRGGRTGRRQRPPGSRRNEPGPVKRVAASRILQHSQLRRPQGL